MNKPPIREEINHHTLKLIVGIIALSLPLLTSYFSMPIKLDSISASYHVGGWPRNIFVGFLFAIAAFLATYNGHTRQQMWLSKVAAVAAILVAMFPCGCDKQPEILPYVHYIAAFVMFVILAVFCYSFYKRAKEKGHTEAKYRATIYGVCGIVIVLSMLIIALDGLLELGIYRVTFYGETAALLAFGVAWLTASRTLPIITTKQERMSVMPGDASRKISSQ